MAFYEAEMIDPSIVLKCLRHIEERTWWNRAEIIDPTITLKYSRYIQERTWWNRAEIFYASVE